MARGRRHRPRAGLGADRSGTAEGRAGRAALGEPRGVGAGRLRDLQRRVRHGAGLPVLSAGPHRLRDQRFGGENPHRGGPGPARQGAPGPGEDAGPRADRRHRGLRRPAAAEDGDDVAHGLTTALAENLDKVGENLREVRPHFICSVPRVFEKVYAKILTGVEAGSPAKQKIFRWAVGVGRDVSRHQQRGQPVPAALEWKRKLAHKLVFSKLHAALGGRLQWAVSGGAPLSRDIAEFFHAAGILLLEGYGLTETCPALTFNREDAFKFGSVGKPMPGVEVKIAPDGESLGRGPNIATRGYFKQPDATKEVFEPSGWFHTGDIGTLDADGFLFITDRKKDLIVTAGGMNIAPQNVENMLKADPFISQVMVHGDRRPYPAALITVNPEELTKFARDQGILVNDPTALVKHPKIVERVGRTVEEKNTQLQSYAKIKKFTVLPGDFSLDGGELTPTLKVKRKVVAQKDQDAIEALYR